MQLYEDTQKLLNEFEMRFRSTQRGPTLIKSFWGYNESGASVFCMYKHTRELTCRMKLSAQQAHAIPITTNCPPATEVIAHISTYCKDCRQWL